MAVWYPILSCPLWCAIIPCLYLQVFLESYMHQHVCYGRFGEWETGGSCPVLGEDDQSELQQPAEAVRHLEKSRSRRLKQQWYIFIKRVWLPWWRSGWESACKCRGHGFEPWSGKIPHATEQLGPWATTTEPARLEPVLRNKRGRDNERPAHHDEEWSPLAATRESPRTETKTQHSQK